MFRRAEARTVKSEGAEPNQFARPVKRLVCDKVCDVDRSRQWEPLRQYRAAVVGVCDDVEEQFGTGFHFLPKRGCEFEGGRADRLVVCLTEKLVLLFILDNNIHSFRSCDCTVAKGFDMPFVGSTRLDV